MKKQDIEEKIRKADGAVRIITSPEWAVLRDYLEERYVELSLKECKTLEDMAARKAGMDEIKGIFERLGGEIRERDFYLLHLRQIESEAIGEEFLHTAPYV